MAKDRRTDHSTAATVGYQAELWRMTDALRGSMDAPEYKHVALGLTSLKYTSDAFEAQHVMLEADTAQGTDPEDSDEYRALKIFWVPREAYWSNLRHRPSNPPLASWWTRLCQVSSATTPPARGCCPRTMPDPPSTSRDSLSSSTPSALSRSATPRAALRTCSAASTSTSSPSLPAPRARRAASSPRRAAWSHRLLKGWYGMAYTREDPPRICINRLLDSPDISMTTMQFLIWHEFLHVHLASGHTETFREHERHWPGYVEAERELDTLNERFGVQYW